MTQNIVALDFNGVRVIIDANTKLKHLVSPNGAGTETLHDDQTGADYQVPTGKKFTVIFIEDIQAGTANDRLISSTAADATTGEIKLWEGATVTNEVFITTEVAADAFITKVDATSTHTYDVWGIEEDA